MSVHPGDSVTVDFTVHDSSSGELSNADSLPVGTLIQNGVDTAVTVVITNKATGRYKAQVIIPDTYVAGDEVQIYISATVNTLDGGRNIWDSTLEPVINVSGYVDDAGPLAADFDGDTGLSTINNAFDGAQLVFTSGALQGIARMISDYTGSSRNIAFTGVGDDRDRPFPAAPANGDTFIIIAQ
jgi:hypothetical protein